VVRLPTLPAHCEQAYHISDYDAVSRRAHPSHRVAEVKGIHAVFHYVAAAHLADGLISRTRGPLSRRPRRPATARAPPFFRIPRQVAAVVRAVREAKLE